MNYQRDWHMSAAGQVWKGAVRSTGSLSRQTEQLQCPSSRATEVSAGIHWSHGAGMFLTHRTAKKATAGKAVSPLTRAKLPGGQHTGEPCLPLRYLRAYENLAPCSGYAAKTRWVSTKDPF